MNRTPTFDGHEAAVLAKADFMAGLDHGEAEALRACATVLLCDPHAVLFEEGDKAAYFYCMLSGYVRLYRHNGNGRQADIRICEPGDSFAECLIHADETYRYGAQAMDHAVLACFHIAKVWLLLDEQPRIGKAIMRSLSLHLISTMECLASDRMQTAPQRVANYLLTHCVENGATASLRLPFPKNLLARKLGLAPEALSRAFSTLKTKGVTVRGRAITISVITVLQQV
ncbi:Crp/Fnr family transcriptional regulator [Rhizobium laguerreae]|uniref:Crp/Fnr family transcriptional regulator n=1 Tax=Rhizobium laguerreae TaxID=1076926 RepID=UPI001C9216F4|nr:Crp/Fnr family transcriptional regulator [Rhizobium laguerreae]MBY3365623.1 Crp/Fnr family transcriptional regulator [Rhizobium laguerreae]